MSVLANIEFFFYSLFRHSGEMLLLLGKAVWELPAALRGARRTLGFMMEFGFYTLPLAAFIGLFTGMVTSLQTGLALKELGSTEMVGAVVGLSLVREMGPVITAFIICGRVGAAMTAELGTMVVTEEVDVLRSLGISPVRYLIVPRFLAALIMVPTLTVYSILIGIWGGALVATNFLRVPATIYYDRVFDAIDGLDIFNGMIKTVVFGVIIAIVCCHMGMSTTNGAAGVGKSTMRAVVVTFTAILISDYFMTRYFPLS